MAATDSGNMGGSSGKPRRLRGFYGVLIALGVVAIAVTLVGVVAILPAPQAEEPVTSIPPINVRVQPVAVIDKMTDTFTLTAVVEPIRVVEVAAEVAGRVEAWGMRTSPVAMAGRELPPGVIIAEGEPIARGDPLILLNRDLLEAAHARVLAQCEYSRREYERVARLFERGATSQTEVDNQRSQRDIDEAMLKEAAFALERATIYAPISGILNDMRVEVGEYTLPGTPVAEIVDIDQVKVVVSVPERDVRPLAVGQMVDVLSPDLSLDGRTGEITYISELADEDTRTTRVEVTVDNDDRRFRSGQIVRARLTRRVLNNVIMVPLDSIIPLEQGRVVYLVDDNGKAERRLVELDFIKGRDVRVLSGLAAGDRLIVSGHRYVGPGQSVEIIPDE